MGKHSRGEEHQAGDKQVWIRPKEERKTEDSGIEGRHVGGKSKYGRSTGQHDPGNQDKR